MATQQTVSIIHSSSVKGFGAIIDANIVTKYS